MRKRKKVKNKLQRLVSATTPESRLQAIREVLGEDAYQKVLAMRTKRDAKADEAGMAERS